MLSPAKKVRRPSFWSILQIIYITALHDIRKSHRSPIIGLLLNLAQTGVTFIGFYLMMNFTGLSQSGIRGDSTLYLLSGVFLYMTHSNTMSAVSGASGAASQMMLHAPMNTLVSICAAALAKLYDQILALIIIFTLYHILVQPLRIEHPTEAFMMMLLAWASGAVIGLFFFALKPWFPNFSSMAASLFSRLNMVASGKMFVANTLPAYLLPLFLWNPLFHLIDQCRDFVFINYEARTTNWQFPLYFIICGAILGLLLESYTRRHASASWSAAR